MVNKGSHFTDFVRFCPHTYTRTQQFLPPLWLAMINELDLPWVPNFTALGIYFLFETNFSWNEGIDTCFNVKYVLLGRNFHLLGGYLVVTARM